jgi:hypothetical protein
LSFGSLREVVMTVVLVGLGVLGIDAGKRAIQSFSPAPRTESFDFETLAKGLGYPPNGELDTSENAIRSQLPSSRLRSGPNTPTGLSDEEVERIAKALWKEMQAGEHPPAVQPASNTVGQNTPGHDVAPQVASNEANILAGRTP